MAIFGKALGNGYAITSVIKKSNKKLLKIHLLAALFGLKELDLLQG